MLGWGKLQEPQVQVDEVAQAEIQRLERMAGIPFPSAQVPACLVEPQKQRSYAEVAQLLGFVPAELTRAQLLEFFEQESIKFYDKKEWRCRPYERLVPFHALEKVAKIETKFGDRVKFFVSDYATPNVDPFIMVRPAACDSCDHEYNLIFDAWDEPGFGV